MDHGIDSNGTVQITTAEFAGLIADREKILTLQRYLDEIQASFVDVTYIKIVLNME